MSAAAAIDTPIMESVKRILAINSLNSCAVILKSVYYGQVLSVPQDNSIP